MRFLAMHDPNSYVHHPCFKDWCHSWSIIGYLPRIRLRASFKRLRWAKLKMKQSTYIYYNKVHYLPDISKEGIAMQNENVEAKQIKYHNHPAFTMFEVSYDYYCRCIANFSNIRFNRQGNNIRIESQTPENFWNDERQTNNGCSSFHAVKQRRPTRRPLTLPWKPHSSKDRMRIVIAYASRTRTKPEHNYETTRKKLGYLPWSSVWNSSAGIYWMNHSRCDHLVLGWLRRTSESLSQLARWLTFIEQFDYTILHRAGQKHGNADSLSRRNNKSSNIELKSSIKPSQPKPKKPSITKP